MTGWLNCIWHRDYLYIHLRSWTLMVLQIKLKAWQIKMELLKKDASWAY